MKVQSLQLKLAQEERDHARTRLERDVLQKRLEGFQRLSAGLARRIDELEGMTPPASCDHHGAIVSDNYGSTCAVCGKQLEGYGYGGWFGRNLDGTERCIHRYVPSFGGDETSPKVCQFCERTEVAN
jgi:hypothetical protein